MTGQFAAPEWLFYNFVKLVYYDNCDFHCDGFRTNLEVPKFSLTTFNFSSEGRCADEGSELGETERVGDERVDEAYALLGSEHAEESAVEPAEGGVDGCHAARGEVRDVCLAGDTDEQIDAYERREERLLARRERSRAGWRDAATASTIVTVSWMKPAGRMVRRRRRTP